MILNRPTCAEIEQRFQSLDNAQTLHLADYPGVYFLCKGATIVYVGKAKNIARQAQVPTSRLT